MLGRRDYTIITCHFGDPFWVRHCLTQVDRLSDDRIAGVIVVDQDRGSSAELARLPRVSSVVEFRVDEEQVEILGHDHPASLNRALAEVQLDTSHVIVLDSDCFPVDDRWLGLLQDITLAADPAKWGLTHPCLMAFPAAYARQVDFAEGLHEVGIDTGRLVGLQLARRGAEVSITRPEGAFRGKRGTFYLDRSIYHHGSSSFASSTDPRLNSVINPPMEALYRDCVTRGRFELSAGERARLAARGLVRSSASAARRAVSR